jgi:hypothetical protein
MQVRSSFIHLITKNTTVKTEFKIDIIWVRLIILKFCSMQDYVIDDVVLIWQLVDDIDTFHVKRMTCSGS